MKNIAVIILLFKLNYGVVGMDFVQCYFREYPVSTSLHVSII